MEPILMYYNNFITLTVITYFKVIHSSNWTLQQESRITKYKIRIQKKKKKENSWMILYIYFLMMSYFLYLRNEIRILLPLPDVVIALCYLVSSVLDPVYSLLILSIFYSTTLLKFISHYIYYVQGTVSSFVNDYNLFLNAIVIQIITF